MDINRINDRIKLDAEFNAAVKAMLNIMETTTLTPLDIRDACYFARYSFELSNPRPIVVSSDFAYRIATYRDS